MRARISKLSLILFVVMVVLGGFLLAVPGNYWPWFAVTALFAAIPFLLGPRRYHWAGLAGLALSALLIAGDYGRGTALHERVQAIHRISAEQSTNGAVGGQRGSDVPSNGPSNR
jgi:membrane protein implicated in regulation of membrane protease activity